MGLKLRTCPFCGQEPALRKAKFGMEPFERYAVFCFDCAICIGWEDSEAEAIERWNRREGENVD